jgi:hypothetical protein
MRRGIVISLVALGVLAAAPAAFADDTECVGTMGAVVVDNLTVPKGATCFLEGTIVQGNVDIQQEAIRDDLRCSQNNPRPVGGDNEVGGTRSGQCRRI